ncbi:sulfatase-like hydrolase/transferase [Pararhizobium sp.]|uniref:sulfatase-like hydrolase/transferase n=1 Tax=Pararhizobium sp. TaxID=1977563 RepID=UPI0027157BB5|nr:sulfatase-like hydrolase/transferase [Pararhizobium sp.]MDO9415975.1 sulfatase-like hydrolase/transferase [Pararhizobium sp.]
MKRIFQRLMAVLFHPAFALLVLTATFYALHDFDTRWKFVPYLMTVIAALASILFLLSRRPWFAAYSAVTLVLAISAMSEEKFQLKGFSLHVFDLAFTGLDPSALSFLAGSYPHILLAGLAVLAATGLFLAALFTGDRPRRLPLWLRSGLVAATCGAVVVVYPVKRGEPTYVYYMAGYNAVSFFISLGDINLPFGKISLVDTVAAAAVDGRLTDDVSCGDVASRPDVFSILSESQTDPANFPQITVPASLQKSFQSDDGKVHPMYVETFGGGTWVTNFSVMTGLSATDFGWQSPYLTQMMEKRVEASFPKLLARCGYRTVVIMPMEYSFVNEGAFLTSLGFQEVVDFKSMAPKDHFVRDSFYFDVAEKLIRQHRKTDKRPLFVALQTMFPHGPYDTSLVPDKDLAREPRFAQDNEANEYMRRVAMAKKDFEAFLAERRAVPGPAGSVVLEYGDHQATATKSLLPAGRDGNIFADLQSPAYRTYFTVHGFGRTIDMKPLALPMDVGFLTASLIEAANLPTSPMFRSLAELRDLCAGRYHACKDRAKVDAHLKERANAGLLLLN